MKQQRKSKEKLPPEQEIKNIFRFLPFRSKEDILEEKEEEEAEKKPFACIPYIPEKTFPLKRALRKAGVTTTFTSGQNLSNILCAKKKVNQSPPKRKACTNIIAHAPHQPRTSAKHQGPAISAGMSMGKPPES